MIHVSASPGRYEVPPLNFLSKNINYLKNQKNVIVTKLRLHHDCILLDSTLLISWKKKREEKKKGNKTPINAEKTEVQVGSKD